MRLRATARFGQIIAGVFLYQDIAQIVDAVYVKNFRIPILIPPLAIIKATTHSTQAAGNVGVGFDGWIENV